MKNTFCEQNPKPKKKEDCFGCCFISVCKDRGFSPFAKDIGWTSEVPTEAGIYLYKAQNGNIMPFEVSRDGYLYYGNTEYYSRKWHGLWHRINYPDPPKD